MKRILNNIKEHHTFAKKHLDKSLFFRVMIFIIIFLIMAGLIIFNVFENKIGIFLASIGLVVGFVVGILTGRAFKIRWNQNEKKVIARIDVLGFIILVPYTIFSIYRERILENWLHGVLLTAFTFSFLAGVMLGRVIYLFIHIKRTLEDRGIEMPKS
ncbi:MAG: hypothetical protein V4504_00760 [Patescibacteria group bacterium]